MPDNETPRAEAMELWRCSCGGYSHAEDRIPHPFVIGCQHETERIEVVPAAELERALDALVETVRGCYCEDGWVERPDRVIGEADDPCPRCDGARTFLDQHRPGWRAGRLDG